MNGAFLDYASTNPYIKFPIDTSKQWRNPNAAYAYEERKMLMDCEDRIKKSIGADGGHILYFRCATEAIEWLHNMTRKHVWGHSPYEHNSCLFGVEGIPNMLVDADFYLHQAVNQLTGQIYDIKAVCEAFDNNHECPSIICDCTAAMGKLSTGKLSEICKCADSVFMSGHKLGCPDIAFMWISDWLAGYLCASDDIRNQWDLRHGSISVGHVLALADAVEWACDAGRIWNNELGWESLVNYLLDELDNAELIGGDSVGTFAINAIRLKGINADSLQQFCASKGIYIGIGASACADKHDYVVLVNGYGMTEQEASEVIRLSFGDDSTVKDIAALVDCVKEYKDKFC